MADSIIALVDCNNFYASCERVFHPFLSQRPIVVLSNNDGCIIARSNEAKKLGIPMGAPAFKYKSLIKDNNVVVFSSNYQLYGDMSLRVMNSIKTLVKNIEIYSIDEAFLCLNEFRSNHLETIGIEIRSKILKWTGMPTSIGIASTKTLSKIANSIAKKKCKSGVFDMTANPDHADILSKIAVESVWGISQRWGQKLRQLGIETALQLRDIDPLKIRQRMGVVAERIVYELRGVSCMPLTLQKKKQSITSSRSFGKPLTKINHIEEALCRHVTSASEKLRRQGSQARQLSVFLTTNPFNKFQNYYHNHDRIVLSEATADTGLLIKQAKGLLRTLYIAGYHYKKCGVTLSDFKDTSLRQSPLFDHDKANQQFVKSAKLMKVIDRINHSIGHKTIYSAAEGTQNVYAMKSNQKSPAYTTNWLDLPVVY